jgi:hypothetical protein
MGVLASKLFTDADKATVDKLEDCATGRPSEVSSHFARNQNQSGEHIRRVKQALKNVQDLEPGLGIPPFTVDEVYDDAFARAVAVYKDKRNIRNCANKIDDIVGIKTIRSLDNDAQKRPRVEPAPKPKKPNVVPRALPNCVTEGDCPTSTEFDVTLLFGVSGGEIGEVSKFFFTIRDTINGVSSLYLLSGGGFGVSPLPVSVADGGGPKHFSTTNAPVRVTRFGPFAAFASATNLVPPFVASATFLTMQFRPDGSGLRLTLPLRIDTGFISIPGASIEGATFKIQSICRGGPGAVRRIITRGDLVFT